MRFYYGEFLSSLEQVPGSIYFIPCCVPLIPGSNLYYAMTGLISNDWDMCRFQLIRLATYAMGIALGLGIVAEMLHILRQIVKAK